MATLSNVPYGLISVTLIQGRKAVTAAGTPEKIVATNTYVESVEFFARKANGTANTGNIYIGTSSSAASNMRVLTAGESWSIVATKEKKINLFDFYVDSATNDDAVVYTAIN